MVVSAVVVCVFAVIFWLARPRPELISNSAVQSPFVAASGAAAPVNVPSIQAVVELTDGSRTILKNVQLAEYGKPVDSIMLSDRGYDKSTVVTISDIANIRRISEKEIEFNFTNGGRKKWRNIFAGITGIDSESLFNKAITYREIITIVFNHPHPAPSD